MNRQVAVLVFTLLIILSLLALLVLCLQETVFHYLIRKQARLIPDSALFQQWKEPTVPILLQIYFFNLSNPSEFLAGGKPFVQQLGPYTYRERRMKRNIRFNDTESTVTYDEVKQYFFLPNASVGTESDQIVNINLVYLTIAVQTERYFKPLTRVIEWAEGMFDERILMRRNVSQWLWGYEDRFLHFIQTIGIPVNVSRIGLLANKNDTQDGPFVMDTGFANSDRFGQILSYHGNRSVSCWVTPEANQINGSDGSLFHPFLQPDQSLYVFAPDLCRSIEFSAHEEVLHNGLWCRKYLPVEDTFDSPKEDPKNRGFCPRWPVCYESGALDMSTCQPGPPVAVSMPHLVHASPIYRDAVDGLHPSAEFNTTFFLEPLTGVVVSAARKLQLNANVTRSSNFRQLSHLPTVLMPIMFLNESATLDADTTRLLRLSVVVIPSSVRAASIVLLCVCLAVLTFLGGLRLRAATHRSVPVNELDQPLLTETLPSVTV